MLEFADCFVLYCVYCCGVLLMDVCDFGQSCWVLGTLSVCRHLGIGVSWVL